MLAKLKELNAAPDVLGPIEAGTNRLRQKIQSHPLQPKGFVGSSGVEAGSASAAAPAGDKMADGPTHGSNTPAPQSSPTVAVETAEAATDDEEFECDKLQEAYDSLVKVVGTSNTSAKDLFAQLQQARLRRQEHKPLEIRVLAASRRVQAAKQKLEKSDARLEVFHKELAQRMAELDEETQKNDGLRTKLEQERQQHVHLVAQLEGVQAQPVEQKVLASKDEAWSFLLGSSAPDDAEQLVQELRSRLQQLSTANEAKRKADEEAAQAAKKPRPDQA